MKINTGAPVDGNEFFGRKRELQNMSAILGNNKKTSILIPGPRRIGKTSIVQEFIRQNSDKYKFIYLDLESRNSVIELCSDLTKKIEKEYPGFIKRRLDLKGTWNQLSEMFQQVNLPGVIGVTTGQITVDIKEIMDRMSDLFETLNKHNFIFALDEFSDFLLQLGNQGTEEAEQFLKWLRGLRQESKVRLIVSGSVNIISTVEELNLSNLINDMADIEIFPLTKE